MSGISSIGSTSSDVYALWLQRVSLGQTTEAESDGDADDSASSGISGLTGAASTGQNDLIQQIQTAIQQALQSSHSSGESSDLLTAISDAIEKTLKDNGIDPEQLTQQMQSSEAEDRGLPGAPGRLGMGPPPPPPNDAASAGNSSSTSSDSNSSDDSSSTTLDQLIKLLKQLFTNDAASSGSNDPLVGLVFNTQA
jgi:hypothetical protein